MSTRVPLTLFYDLQITVRLWPTLNILDVEEDIMNVCDTVGMFSFV